MKIITAWTLEIVMISTIFRYCFCVVAFTNFRRHAITNVRLSPVTYSTNITSPTACTALCKSSKGCLAVNFRVDTYRCELVDKTGYFRDYETTSVGDWKVYSDVTADTMFSNCKNCGDCLEPNSRCVEENSKSRSCFCLPLYGYKAQKRSCERVCQKYSTNFTAHPGLYIIRYNKEPIYIINPENLHTCKQMCLETGDECQSIDYSDVRIGCRLNTITKDEAIEVDALGRNEDDILYTKDCEL